MQPNQTDKRSYTVKELIGLPHQEISFLWGEIIPKVGITFLTGSSDCNKSTFLRQLCLCIGAGKTEFLNLPLNVQHGKCLYISTEDEKNAISIALKKQILNDETVKTGEENTNFVFDVGDNYLENIDKYLTQIKCDLVVIDTWTDLYHGDLNQSNKVRNNLDGFFNIAKKHECAFIFVHHTRKGTEDREAHKGDMLGSQGIEAKARTVMLMKKESANLRSIKILKGNYTPENVKSTKMRFTINENLWLTFESNTLDIGYSFEQVAERAAKRDEMKKILFEEREKDTSYSKIHTQLLEQFGTDTVSETTLKNWMKEVLGSQEKTTDNGVSD